MLEFRLLKFIRWNEKQPFLKLLYKRSFALEFESTKVDE